MAVENLQSPATPAEITQRTRALRAAIAAGSLETYQVQFAKSLAEGDLPEA